ncbi:MAG: glycosyltransferase [Acidimicrobiia bacterium]
MVSLTVIVPATDEPATLKRCLAAIAAADDAPDEIIVVDQPTTLSASAARNVGVAGASTDVVVFVDSDVVVHADVFRRIRTTFANDPELDAVYGSYDDAPGAPGAVSRFRNLLHHHVHQMSAGPADTFWTGLGAVRRTSFDAAGGFDAVRYPHPSIEDIEFGRRLDASGGRILLDPEIQGTHLKAWTLRSMVWTDLARRAIPWVALEWRSRSLSPALNLGWSHRISAVLCVVGAIALLTRVWMLAAVALVTLVTVNHRFYGLLVRRLGIVRAGAGVLLHVVHHLVAVLAVPIGIAAGVMSGSNAPGASRDGPTPAVGGDAATVLK